MNSDALKRLIPLFFRDSPENLRRSRQALPPAPQRILARIRNLFRRQSRLSLLPRPGDATTAAAFASRRQLRYSHILRHIPHDGAISSRALCSLTGLHHGVMKLALRQLVAEGILVKHGKTKGATFGWADDGRS